MLGARECAGQLGDDDVVAELRRVGEDRQGPGDDLVGVLALDDQAAVELVLPEVAERLVLDHDDALVEPGSWGGHASQAAAERLLGKDPVRGAERAEGDDHADVADVPAFAEHQDADDAADPAVGRVDVAGGAAGEVEVVLGDLAAAVGVDDEQLVAGEVGELLQVVAGFVRGERVLAHHEQHGPLARRRERLVEDAPAADGDVEPLPVALERRVAELDGRAGDLADDRGLDDPVRDGLRERVVDDDVTEHPAVLVLRRGGVVELGDDAGAPLAGRPCAELGVQALDRLVPLELLVMDVVRLVVEDHHALAARRSGRRAPQPTTPRRRG